MVALFVSQGSGQSFEFAGAESAPRHGDGQAASPRLAKENKQKIVVIKPAKVNKFKMTNPNWKDMHRAVRGKAPRGRLRPGHPPRQAQPLSAG